MWIKLHIDKQEYQVSLDLGLIIEPYKNSREHVYSLIKQLSDCDDLYWDESPDEIMALMEGKRGGKYKEALKDIVDVYKKRGISDLFDAIKKAAKLLEK